MYENEYANIPQARQMQQSQQTQQVMQSQQVPQSMLTAAQSAPVKKKGIGTKILGMICSGFLFGSFAGIAVVIILTLFPVGGTADTAKEPEKNTTPIEQAQQVNQDEKKETEQPDKADETTEKSKREESDISVYTQDGGIDATTTADSSLASSDLAVVTDVTKVVDSVMPCVVSIFGTYAVTEHYWGYQFTQNEEGSGSGFIVGENGEELLLVTNNHVVADATSLSVQFIDDTTCEAVVKGTNAQEDLAVIAVRLSSLNAKTKEAIKVATLGDSDKLKVGEPAIAIGNALGYGQSVTTGVISAVNRGNTMDENGHASMLIQTDAAINPGNSGGALLNVYGEVIGINSSKLAGTTIEGMGYAIPISTAKPIIEELMSKKTRVPVSENKKGYLGISGINVTEQVHEMYDLPIGVYIAQVMDGTAAQKAGIKKGDVITAIDGDKVETMEELSAMLDCLEAGSSVEIAVMAAEEDGYQQKLVTVILGSRNP